MAPKPTLWLATGAVRGGLPFWNGKFFGPNLPKGPFAATTHAAHYRTGLRQPAPYRVPPHCAIHSVCPVWALCALQPVTVLPHRATPQAPQITSSCSRATPCMDVSVLTPKPKFRACRTTKTSHEHGQPTSQANAHSSGSRSQRARTTTSAHSNTTIPSRPVQSRPVPSRPARP